ncbi:MAG: ABC-F family ATP-binding cassette domain-containing protein [Victivallaceae bacterium]|nr:ABC-F family ATP-binding cassette domain-containing protein [Victivallaceae bacterium]
MIDGKDISKHFGGQVIFDCADFRVNAGERVGVVGPNGCGKTTLFGIITGDVEPDGGRVSLPKNLRIGYLRQQLPLESSSRRLIDFVADAIPELTGISAKLHELEHRMENSLSGPELEAVLNEHGQLQSLFERLGGYTLRSDAAAALSGLGFTDGDFTKSLEEFSGGWQMRAALTRMLISHPDVLLLDEPSNYLDLPAVEWLYRFLQNFRGTLLLISHDRYLLRKLCGVILEVNGGRITRYPGNYDYYRQERGHRQKTLEAAKLNQDKKRDRLQRNINRFRAQATKAAQAKSWQKQLDRMETIGLPSELKFSGRIRIPDAPPCGAEAARFERVSFAYPGGKKVFDQVELQIDAGSKIAFVGYNGAGKTTLLKLLTGNLKPDSGKVVLGHNIVTGYQAQEFADILPDGGSVFDVVRAAAGTAEQLAAVPGILGSFGFGADSMNKTCGVLSGGEKIRLCFARIFVNPPNLLVLDEPTTHLDIVARETLQEALAQYQGTVCLVSHDIEFVRAAAGIIVALRPPGIRKYFGDYEYYLEKSAQENLGVPEPEIVTAEAAKTSDSREQRRTRARRRQELAGTKKKAERAVKEIESRIEQLEAERTAAVEQMNRDEKVDFAVLNRHLAQLQSELDRSTAEWEKALENLEEIVELNAAVNVCGRLDF